MDEIVTDVFTWAWFSEPHEYGERADKKRASVECFRGGDHARPDGSDQDSVGEEMRCRAPASAALRRNV